MTSIKAPPALFAWSTHFRHTCGFTLIELMIAVAVLAIVASIAYPSYQDSIRKSRRSDAMVALQQIQLEQEKFRANCPTYAGNLTGTKNCGATAALSNLGLSSTASANGYYALEVVSASDTGFSAQATAVAAQASDTSCATFTLAVAGLHVTPTATNSSCWVK